MPRRKVLAFSYSTPEREWVDVSERLGEYLVGVEIDGEFSIVLRGGEHIIDLVPGVSATSVALKCMEQSILFLTGALNIKL